MINFRENSGHLFGSVFRTWETLGAIAKNRVELAKLEWKEEETRLVSGAIWGGVFLFTSFMAVVTVASTILFFWWEHKLYVALGLLGFCLVNALASFFFFQKARKRALPFAETITQFKKDRAWLRGEN